LHALGRYIGLQNILVRNVVFAVALFYPKKKLRNSSSIRFPGAATNV
jgi:hypothetical protein